MAVKPADTEEIVSIDPNERKSWLNEPEQPTQDEEAVVLSPEERQSWLSEDAVPQEPPVSKPEYGSLMFDTPAGPPTTDTETVRSWETPNSIVAIGKTPRNQIVTQSEPKEVISEEERAAFLSENADVAPQPIIQSPELTQIPSEVVSTPQSAAMPVYQGLPGQMPPELNDDKVAATFLQGLADNPQNPWTNRAQMMLKSIFAGTVRAGRAVGQLWDMLPSYSPAIEVQMRAKAAQEGKEYVDPFATFKGAFDKPTDIEQKAQTHAERILQDNLQAGGVPLAIIGEMSRNISVQASEMAIPMGILGIGKKAQVVGKPVLSILDMAKHALPGAAEFGGYTFLTSEGSVKERTKKGIHSAVFVMSPVVGAGVSKPLVSKIISTAINMGYNSPAYVEAYSQAEEMARVHGGTTMEWLVSTATPLLMGDILFGFGGKNLKQMREEYSAQLKKNPEGAKVLAKQAQELLDKKLKTPPPLPQEEGNVPRGTIEPPAKYRTPEESNELENLKMKRDGLILPDGKVAQKPEMLTYEETQRLEELQVKETEPVAEAVTPAPAEPPKVEPVIEPVKTETSNDKFVATPSRVSERTQYDRVDELEKGGLPRGMAILEAARERQEYEAAGKPWPPPEGTLPKEKIREFEVNRAAKPFERELSEATTRLAIVEKELNDPKLRENRPIETDKKLQAEAKSLRAIIKTATRKAERERIGRDKVAVTPSGKTQTELVNTVNENRSTLEGVLSELVSMAKDAAYGKIPVVDESGKIVTDPLTGKPKWITAYKFAGVAKDMGWTSDKIEGLENSLERLKKGNGDELGRNQWEVIESAITMAEKEMGMSLEEANAKIKEQPKAEVAKPKEIKPDERPLTPEEESKLDVQEKNAPPSRSRNIGRGMNGSVRVEFPSDAEAMLFSYMSRVKQSMSGKNQRPNNINPDYIKKQLGLTDEEFNRLATEYPEKIKKEIADLKEGDVHKASPAKESTPAAEDFDLFSEKQKDSKVVDLGDGDSVEHRKDGKVIFRTKGKKSVELDPNDPGDKILIDETISNSPEENVSVKAKLKEEVSKLNKGSDKVVILDTATELPEGAKSRRGGKVEGVYVGKDGKSYLVVENIRPGEEGRVVIHEAVIHGGLRTVMTERQLSEILDRTFLNEGEGAVRVANKIKEGMGRIEAIEEVIADIWSKRETNPTVWNRLKAEVRNFLRKFNPKLEWSENDIDMLIENAARNVKKGEGRLTSSGTMFSQNTKAKRAAEAKKREMEREQEGVNKEEGRVGIKNAVMRDKLLARGLPEVPEAETKGWQEEVDEAIIAMRENPDLPDTLINELLEGKRKTIEAWEHAVLDAKAVELEQRFDTAVSDFENSKGNKEIERSAASRSGSIEDQLQRLAMASKLAGTATARSLAFRKAMFNNDFTLANLMVRKRAANNNRPVTEKTKDRLKRLTEKNKQLLKEIETLKKKEKADISDEKRESITRMIWELFDGKTIKVNKAAKESRKSSALSSAEKLRAMGIIGDEPITRKSEKGGDSSITNDAVELAADIGARFLEEGTVNREKWETKMRVALGPRIESRLGEILERALEMVREDKTAEKSEPVVGPEKEKPISKLKPKLTPEEKKDLELDRKISEMKDRIEQVKAGTYIPKSRKTPLPVSREIQAKMNELKKLRDDFNEELKRDKRNGDDWVAAMNSFLTEKKITLSDEVRSGIETELRAASKIEDPAARDKAVAEAINKLVAQTPLSAGDWYEAYIYTNMLSSPLSQGRNIYGNFLNAFITRPSTLLLQGEIKGWGSYTGNAIKSIFTAAPWREGYKAYMSGEEGKLMETIKQVSENVPELEKQKSMFERAKRIQGPNSWLGKQAWYRLTAVGRFMQAADVYFGTILEAGETARLVNKGESPETAMQQARQLADQYLYRDKVMKEPDLSLDWFSRQIERGGYALDHFRNGSKITKIVVVPFLRTPVKIAQFNAQMTPFAFIGANRNRIARARFKGVSADEMLKQLEKEVAKNEPNMDEVDRLESQMQEIDNISGERYGKAMAGSLLMALGFAAAASGNTTWAAPTDPKLKKLYYDAGYKPYSFRIPGTEVWVPMMYLGPGALAFMIPAAANDIWKKNPDTVTENAVMKTAQLAMQIPVMMLDQLPVAGLASIYQTIKGREDWNISKIAGRAALQNVPMSGFLNWVRTIVDPEYKKATTIEDTIKAGIPGLSESVKALKTSEGLDARMSLADALLPYKAGLMDHEKEEEYQRRLAKLRLNARIKARKTKK